MLRLYQLWAVLFQFEPSKAANEEFPAHIQMATPNYILAALSMILPEPNTSAHAKPRDMRISIDTSLPSPQEPYGPTLKWLIQSLAHGVSPQLIILTGNATTATSPTVVGAYFSSPSSNVAKHNRQIYSSALSQYISQHLSIPSSNVEEDNHQFRVVALRFLFQLLPQFRLFRLKEHHVPLTNIENTGDQSRSGAFAASSESYLPSTAPYVIGDQEGKYASLCIDPESMSATLRSNTMVTDSVEDVGCEPMSPRSNSSDTIDNGNYEVSLKIDRFEIFQVKGWVDEDATSKGVESTFDKSRYVPYSTENKIQGEKLRERIQGFGSDSNMK